MSICKVLRVSVLYLTTDQGGHDDRIIPTPFEFSYLSEDKTMATFKILERDIKDELKDGIQRRIRLALEDRIHAVEAPAYVIQICKEFFDAPIPGVRSITRIYS